MTPLLIIKTKAGFALVELPGTLPAIDLSKIECYESIGGRYSTGGVIDAVREHFTPLPVAEVTEPGDL
jgi:hypothetical protein